MNSSSKNPFDVQTPEHLSPEDFSELFVDEGSDHYRLERLGHTFVIGPRGVGKSMIFRLMEPDCLSRMNACSTSELPFYGAYIPIKDAQTSVTELLRLDALEHGASIINEHILINHICSKLIRSLIERSNIDYSPPEIAEEIRSFVVETALPLLQMAGADIDASDISLITGIEALEHLSKELDRTFAQTSQFLRRIAFRSNSTVYEGSLFGYKETLEPLVKALKSLSFMPDGPIYLLLDDADNLNEIQTQLLNTWVATRSTGYLCLKISVQNGKYKSYRTITGRRINSPHDFSEVDITRLYTTDSDRYRTWVKNIVEKRLRKHGLSCTANEFFPPDAKQEKAISAIADSYRERHDAGLGRGTRRSDDALRYARPDYIKSLSGKSKSLPSYSYAGFDQLVHISSGVIRHFLEPASLMFSEASSVTSGGVVYIPDRIQDSIIKEYSRSFLFEEFSKRVEDAEGDPEAKLDRPTKLKNLINALGKLFHLHLISDGSERKKISIALQDHPDPEVKEILDLGIQYGYFHPSTLGSKEGIGRVPLYVLSRRLAPIFTLDPGGFAGYQFITCDALRSAMYNPKAFIAQVKVKGLTSVEDIQQGDLFGGHTSAQ